MTSALRIVSSIAARAETMAKLALALDSFDRQPSNAFRHSAPSNAIQIAQTGDEDVRHSS